VGGDQGGEGRPAGTDEGTGGEAEGGAGEEDSSRAGTGEAAEGGAEEEGGDREMHAATGEERDRQARRMHVCVCIIFWMPTTLVMC